MRVVDELLHLHRIDDELALAAEVEQAIGHSAGIKGHGGEVPFPEHRHH